MIELQKNDFEKFYAILLESFPPDELRSKQEHRDLLERSDYMVYAHYEAGEPVGFLTLWDLQEYYFVEHFAVRSDQRNTGLGSCLLRLLQQMLEKPVCLEAELPDTEIAKRRIGFYERNGFHKNDYPYMQPPLEKGKKPVPLCIMTTGSTVDQVTFERIREGLYTQVYAGKI